MLIRTEFSETVRYLRGHKSQFTAFLSRLVVKMIFSEPGAPGVPAARML